MITSGKLQGNKTHCMRVKQTELLKHAVIYGANASGKSNLIAVFSFLKQIVTEGLSLSSANAYCRSRPENKMRESCFEIQFTSGSQFYAYGFSALLSQGLITEEWLYELNQDGGGEPLFIRKRDQAPELGEQVKLEESEQSRYRVYSEDFAGNVTQLFLTEMNRGKKYSEHSKLLFFRDVYNWITRNILVITPNTALTNTESFYNDESLEHVSELIQTFDTGITNIRTKVISREEMSRTIPMEMINAIFEQLNQQMKRSGRSNLKMTWRLGDGIYSIRLNDKADPEITTLVLNHGDIPFEFSEESDGTKRLFDLIDMLLTDRPDTVYVVDELERSLHPKLTEHFLRLFMEAHKNSSIQLIVTTHESTIMDQSLFRRDEIWFVERNNENATRIYSLDQFKERYDKKLSKAYLEGRYGAIPVFHQFSFQKGDT